MIKIFVCGDIINRFYDKQFIGDGLIEEIQKADYAVCNLEGCMLPGSVKERKGVYQHDTTLESLKDAGFDLLLLANNHICDWGYEGVYETRRLALGLGFDVIGADFSEEKTYAPLLMEIKGKKFAFINVAEAQVGQFVEAEQEYGYAWLGHWKVEEHIRTLKGKVDYILLFVHAGLEHYDVPLKEWRNLYRHFCDMGVNCIIGTHPHLVQGIEQYGDSIIFYSLGNFYFPKSGQTGDIEDEAYSVELQFGEKNDITYHLIYHKVENQKIIKKNTQNTLIDIFSLCEKLQGPLYDTIIRNVYHRAYETLCYGLYREALCGTEASDNWLLTLKTTFKYWFCRNKYYKDTQKYRNDLLLRLIRNETYRFVAENGLEIRNGRK